MVTRTKQAVPTVPPFAMPTWIRPLVGAGEDGVVLAGGWTSTTQFDVVTRALDGQLLITRMSESAIIQHADDRRCSLLHSWAFSRETKKRQILKTGGIPCFNKLLDPPPSGGMSGGVLLRDVWGLVLSGYQEGLKGPVVSTCS